MLIFLDQFRIYQYTESEGLACIIRCQNNDTKPYLVKLKRSDDTFDIKIEVIFHYLIQRKQSELFG